MFSHHRMGDNGNDPDRMMMCILLHKHHKRHRYQRHGHQYCQWLSKSGFQYPMKTMVALEDDKAVHVSTYTDGAWVTVRVRHKEKKVHKDKKERQIQPKWRSRPFCHGQRSNSLRTQTKPRKYHKKNLARLQALSLHCYFSSQDQHPDHTVHRPLLLRPVHKEHRPAPPLRMNPRRTMKIIEKENLAQQYKVHEVSTPKEQCSIQTFTFWSMMCIGQWCQKHIRSIEQQGHFVSWLRKTENNRIFTIWLQNRVCSDHCALVKWPTIPAAHDDSSSATGVDTQTRDMLERWYCHIWKSRRSKSQEEIPCTNRRVTPRSTKILQAVCWSETPWVEILD